MSKRLTSHHLISRNTDGSNTLCVDFDPHVIRFFHEVNYWERQNFDMPYSKDVIELASNAEKLRVLRQTIGLVVRDFNAIVLKLNEEELALFGERIFFVERKLKPGIDKLTWASKPQILQTYAKDCRRYCNEVYQTAIKFKANHRTIMENCPSFAYSLPVHSFHTRRDRVASFDSMPFAWRVHTKSLTTRARPSPDLAVWLE